MKCVNIPLNMYTSTSKQNIVVRKAIFPTSYMSIAKFSTDSSSYSERLLSFFCFFDLDFLSRHSRITGLQGKGEGISLTPHYHFYPLRRHLDIRRTITAESSPLHR